MSLAKHLRIGTPLIWVQTDEPERQTDVVVQHARRPVFRLDPFEGLVVWKDERWKKVLVKIEGEDTTTFDFAVALQHVVKNKGLFILTNAHLIAEKLLDMLSGIYGSYRVTFNTNDNAKLPAQFVMMSFNDDVPAEIVRHTALITPGLPSGEELAEIALFIDAETPDKEVLPPDPDLTPLVRAGLGLTEAEFTQAAMLCLEHYEKLDPKVINKYKLSKIKERGNVEVRTPTVSLEDVGGLDLAKDLINNISWAWNNPVEASELLIKPLRRVLLVGVPGTGKSFLCEATARSLGTDLAKTGVAQQMSKWIGESERQMREAFQQVAAMAPITLWIDELGRDLSGGGTSNDAGTTDRVHGEFLTGLQELPNDVFLMAAANRIDGLPPEMLRADRFDKIMFVGFPTAEERAEIFKIHLEVQAPDHDLEALASATPTFTGAEIKSLIIETRFRVSSAEKRPINTSDLIGLVPVMRNRVYLRHKSNVVNMYKRAQLEFEWASSGQVADSDDIINGTVTAGNKSKAMFSF